MLEKKLTNFLDGDERSMVAAWKVVGGRLMLERHTNNFPVDDFLNAVELLRKDLKNEQQRCKEVKQQTCKGT